MKTLRNQKGFALGFVLILCVIGLVMTAAMMTMVSHGTFVSAQQRRFRTAVEAGMGGIQSIFHLVGTRGNITIPTTDLNLLVDRQGDFRSKINFPYRNSDDTVNTAWIGLDTSLTIDPSNLNTYDMSIELGTYKVFMKIVDTVEGNSASDEGLLKSGVVNSGSGEITVPSVPYLYTIEVLSQTRVTTAAERSRISVLYQY